MVVARPHPLQPSYWLVLTSHRALSLVATGRQYRSLTQLLLCFLLVENSSEFVIIFSYLFEHKNLLYNVIFKSYERYLRVKHIYKLQELIDKRSAQQ